MPTTHSPAARPSTSPPAPAAAVARTVAVAWGLAALVMVIGAGIYAAVAGVGVDAAVQSGTVPRILPDVVAASGAMSTTYVLWLAAMPLFAVAAWSLPALPFRPAPLRAAAASLAIGASMAAVAFVVLLTFVQVAAPAGADDLAAALAWLGTTLDWVATPLVIAVPPALLVLVADEDRRVFPGWLRGAAMLLVPASLAAYVSLALGTGLDTWGFLVVPVGVVVTIGVALTLWRQP